MSKSAAKIEVVDSSGASHKIPDTPEQRALAAQHGFKVAPSTLETVGGIAKDAIKANYPGLMGGTLVNQAPAGEQLRAEGRIAIVDPDGSVHSIPNTPEQRKIAVDHGFRIADMAAEKDRAAVVAYETTRNPENQGARGAVRTALQGASNEFISTSTLGVVDPEKLFLTKQQTAANDALKDEHAAANIVGKGAGLIAGAVVDPIGANAAASKIGAKLEQKVMGETTKLGSKVVGGMISGAGTGAVMTAPEAARQAIAGDYEKAAETMLVGVGVGSIFGGGGRLAGAAKKAALEKGTKLATEVGEGAEARLNRIGSAKEAAETGSAEALERATAPLSHGEEVAERIAIDGTKTAVKGVGGAVGGAVGGFAGAYVGKHVAEHLAQAIEGEAAQKFITKAIRDGAKGLVNIAPTIDQLANKAGRTTTVSSIHALTQLVGGEEKKSKQESFTEVRDKLTALQSDPEKRTEAMSKIAAAAGNGPQADALNEKANMALDYLYAQLPKEPMKPSLFQGKQKPWMPSENDLARYERKVQVVMDPFSVIEELKKGTLTREHVDALKAVYPALAFEFRERILNKAADPKAPAVSKQHRAKLQLLLGMPLDSTSDPSAVALYQSFYKKELDGEGGGGKKMGELPGAQATAAQSMSERK